MQAETIDQFAPRVSFGRFSYALSTIGLAFAVQVARLFDPGERFLVVIALVVACVTVFLVSLRMLDIGMSGWWALASLVPIVNLYVLWCCVAKPTGYAISGRADSSMKINTAAYITLPPFFVLIIFLMLGLGHDPHEIPSPLINKPAPAFQLKQLQDPAKTFSAQEMRGKVWLLNFWGTWCVACREEHPLLIQYAKTNAVPIYGVDYKDERATAMQMLDDEGNPYTLTASDPDGRLSIDYGVYGAPETFLIDRDGVIRYKQIGPITEDAWQKEILPRVKQLNQ